MNSEFKPMPTAVGAVLGGLGGHVASEISGGSPEAKALLRIGGAALGGGLGYLASKQMSNLEADKAQVEEARKILRRRNQLATTAATSLATGISLPAAYYAATGLAAKHHRDSVIAGGKPMREWNKKVLAAAYAAMDKERANIADNIRRQFPNTQAEAIIRAATEFQPNGTPEYRQFFRRHLQNQRNILSDSKPVRRRLTRGLFANALRKRRIAYGLAGLAGVVGSGLLAYNMTKDSDLDRPVK